MYVLEGGMGIKDLIITPVYIILLSSVANFLRPYVTTKETRKYFLPALWVRFFGAIMLGVIYQFYYGGGDTFNYFTHGSKYIWEAFLDDPILGLKILLESGGGERMPETFQYSQHIWYYRDPRSFLVVKIVAVIDLLTFHTYGATALFFAAFSFSGLWAMYLAVAKMYKNNERWLAIAILFVPSVIFWGSGILKDTITLGALGWLTYASIGLIDKGQYKNPLIWILTIASSYLIYNIKSYILISFLPTAFVWIYWKYQSKIKNVALKLMIAPILLMVFALAGYFALDQVSAYDEKYSLDSFAQQAAITAYDIRYGWGARTGGDGGYDIGIPDGTLPGMLKLLPAAINVSLFRPYIWEVRNPLMLLSALESLVVLLLTLVSIFNGGLRRAINDPFLVFSLVFSLLFAFAVGVSTANFGTLMRYKIPLMSFFLIFLSVKKKQ